MSFGDSEPAPTYYFSGILFNPSFYTSSSATYLTQTTAKKYFLSYPYAQGSETITTLKSSLIDPFSTSLDIGSASASSIINIGTNTGRTGTINIGNAAITGLGNNIGIGSALSNTSIAGKYIELAALTNGISINTSGNLDIIAAAYNIGTTLIANTNINIGTTGKTTTSINGTLNASIGTISGKTSTFICDTSSLSTASVSLDPTTLNLKSFMYFFGGASPAFSYIVLAGGTAGQQIIFRNNSGYSITIQFNANIILTTSASGVSSTVLAAGSTIDAFYQNSTWNQTNVSASLALSGSLTLSNPLILPTTTTTPTNTQLGYNSSVTNATQVDIGTGSSGTILTTGAVLPIGIYMVNISLAEIMNPNSVASATSFGFTLINTTLTGALANNLLILLCTGSTATNKYSFTYSVIAKVTATSGTITLTGSNSAACNCTYSVGQAIMSWIKIA